MATCGAGGISKDKPVQLSNYPYPIYTVYANQKEDDVYMLTKAMIEGYDAYKDGAPGATGMAAKLQTKNWSVPVHKGAVKALKEAGAWSDDQEKHNNNLYKRQETLIAAWADFNKASPPSDREGVRRRLDEDARRRAFEGGHGKRLLIRSRSCRDRKNLGALMSTMSSSGPAQASAAASAADVPRRSSSTIRTPRPRA